MPETVTAALRTGRRLEPKAAAGAIAPMDWMHKLANLLGIGVPVLRLIAAVVPLWDRGAGVAALAILAGEIREESWPCSQTQFASALSSCAQRASMSSGLRPAFWLTGPVEPDYSSCGDFAGESKISEPNPP